MFISVIKQTWKSSTKTAFIYLIVSIVCAVSGAIYEWFSHGVYSYGSLFTGVLEIYGTTNQ